MPEFINAPSPRKTLFICKNICNRTLEDILVRAAGPFHLSNIVLIARRTPFSCTFLPSGKTWVSGAKLNL